PPIGSHWVPLVPTDSLLTLSLLSPQAQVVANNDEKRSFSVTYVPKVAGLHKVTVLFGGQNISGSPFGVNVAMAHGDASKVSARGPGIEPSGNVATKATYFDIYTAGGRGAS
ncbi:filamin-C-like, partial [Meleagris gallopavo]|uniref:filamin-C-like n=1 Tax=Meleagris gallopavo TaxID=9103 RepID=UPI000549B988